MSGRLIGDTRLLQTEQVVEILPIFMAYVLIIQFKPAIFRQLCKICILFNAQKPSSTKICRYSCCG